MKTKIIFLLILTLVGVHMSSKISAQQCLLTGGCLNFRNPYPQNTTFTPTTSWSTQGFMSPGNYTLFNVTIGNIYEWTYCEVYGGVSTAWDAQLTLFRDNNLSNPLCFSTDVCGANSNAPYIRWTADFTGVARILTTRFLGVGCLTADVPSFYNTLAWRQVGGATNPSITVTSPNGGENWQIGSTYNITWTSTSLTGNVNIEVNGNFPNGAWEPLFMNTTNDGIQAWTIAHDAAAGTAKRIRVTSVNNTSIFDISNT